MKTIDCRVPDGISGHWKIETFEVSKEDASFSRIRAIMHPEEIIEPGTYKRLTHQGDVVMSNTPMEIATNRAIIRMATGRTLLNGLGLGMVPAAILPNPKLTELWIVEKSADVIRLVGPTVTKDTRVRLIHSDAMTYRAPKGVRFNAVWHDIWNSFCSDNLPQMATLTRRYARRSDWQGCWGYAQCLRAQRRWG